MQLLLSPFYEGKFVSDGFWEFLRKLLKPLSIQAAKFQFIAKGDSAS